MKYPITIFQDYELRTNCNTDKFRLNDQYLQYKLCGFFIVLPDLYTVNCYIFKAVTSRNWRFV